MGYVDGAHAFIKNQNTTSPPILLIHTHRVAARRSNLIPSAEIRGPGRVAVCEERRLRWPDAQEVSAVPAARRARCVSSFSGARVRGERLLRRPTRARGAAASATTRARRARIPAACEASWGSGGWRGAVPAGGFSGKARRGRRGRVAGPDSGMARRGRRGRPGGDVEGWGRCGRPARPLRATGVARPARTAGEAWRCGTAG